MMRDLRTPSARAMATLMGMVALSSCIDGPVAVRTPVSDGMATLARATSGVAVTEASPPFGRRGEVGKQVTITGSGFAPGAVASWQRNGVDDPKIRVASTTYVSSTQLVATIDIASDAALSFYAVAVTNPDRKGGIGTEAFEVTQAILIAGTEIAYGGNDNGEVTGRVGVPGVFYFNASLGLDTLGSPGRGFDISVDGLTIVGGTTINSLNDQAYVYVNTGGSWQRTNLPKAPTSTMTRPLAVASDATTGAAAIAGGWESSGSSGKSLNRRPRLWTNNGSSWTRVILPYAGSDDYISDVAPNGVAVGVASARAASWDPIGSGSWALTLFGAAASEARGINSTGTLAVGTVSAGGGKTAAVYWVRSGATWSAAVSLPGGCASAEAVDDAGRIVLNGCANGSRLSPAVIVAPYTAGDVTFLGGLGDAKGTASVENISLQGSTIVGQATLKSATYGVMWQMF